MPPRFSCHCHPPRPTYQHCGHPINLSALRTLHQKKCPGNREAAPGIDDNPLHWKNKPGTPSSTAFRSLYAA